MGWQQVSNAAFRRFRTETGRGHDFLLYSDIEFSSFNMTIHFDADTGKELPG
jgi:hypothetical protein